MVYRDTQRSSYLLTLNDNSILQHFILQVYIPEVWFKMHFITHYKILLVFMLFIIDLTSLLAPKIWASPFSWWHKKRQYVRTPFHVWTLYRIIITLTIFNKEFLLFYFILLNICNYVIDGRGKDFLRHICCYR